MGTRIARAWSDAALLPERGLRRTTPRVQLVGVGEAYAAWALDVEPSERMLLRIPWREPTPRSLAREAEALRQVPVGAGPRLLQALEADGPLGTPALLLTWQSGRQLAPEDWQQQHLIAHGRRLAHLHQRAMPGRGAVGGPFRDPTSVVGEVQQLFQRARTEDAELLDAHALHPLLEAAQRTVERVPWRNTPTVLCHGDLCATNILWETSGFGSSGSDAGPTYDTGPAQSTGLAHSTGLAKSAAPPRGPGPAHGPGPAYIDFEWAQADDPARDLAIIAGPIHGGPWYVPASEADVRALLKAYLVEHARIRRGAPQEQNTASAIDALLTRIPAWWAYERTAMLLHCWRRAEAGSRMHRLAAQNIQQGLTSLLGVG